LEAHVETGMGAGARRARRGLRVERALILAGEALCAVGISVAGMRRANRIANRI